MTAIDQARIAILATDGYERSELREPLEKLRAQGAKVDVVSPKSGDIRSWDGDDWGDSVPVDRAIDAAKVEDYDALVLPGGVANPDALRMDEKAVAFVRDFVDSGKPVAAICHAAWTLVEADRVQGKRVASWPSLQTDIRNGGGEWVDEEVVVDGNLITSRNPDDIPAFSKALLGALDG